MQEKLALSPLEWKFMEERKIVQQLLSCEATQEGYPTVIPKTSIGGIGKTSRARLAYNDERVTQHFDVKIWVFVSEIFYAKMITKTVTESATKKICKKEMDALQSKLWGLLHRKRYLIVLDDAWSKDHIEWGKLRPLLRGGLAGSTLIITSRSKKVAMMMDSPIFPYHLKGLDEDDCCALFRQRAFRRGEEEQDPNLLPIGKQIARKFGGLPLAAKTLGSLTRFEREDRECLRNQGEVNSSMDGRGISTRGVKPPEDIGNEYFKDLLWMVFFQDAEKYDDGNMNCYKMHDIIHDLARYVSGEEFMIVEHDLLPFGLVQTCHSCSVGEVGSFTVPEALYEAEQLRTLLLVGVEGLKDIPFKLVFPPSVERLRHLQTLNLYGCTGLAQLPDLTTMADLRHLILTGRDCLPLIPFSIRKLHLLQALPKYFVHRDYNCTRHLAHLDLCGDLKISTCRMRIHLILTGCEALTSIPFNIEELPQLQTLPTFIVDGYYNGIQHLEHVNLHERIPEIHSISGSFLAGNTFLTSLEIISCPKLILIPSELGSLTALKSLTIRWCEELMSLPQSLQNPNALESLEISECYSMASLADNGPASRFKFAADFIHRKLQ
ncbi:disease resistance protein RGA2 [Populus trichocarpa]|uniref:disease resistance protein RGA2 n=1 Tax=Populus trichocarpa TaxID=3694 RepID=UPI000D188875|nr:disease resistance protein RGA2 [Populus trichocarpa]|eukprot:XP_024464541.1 disease resistance protein RGA2 [Populus trichocarpa]